MMESARARARWFATALFWAAAGAAVPLAQSDAVRFAEGQAALDKFRDCGAAIRAFDSVSPQGKQSPLWVFYMAKAYECAGDYRSALAMYERYDRMKPGQAEVIAKIGELRYLAGKAERDARAAQERAAQERATKEAADRVERRYAEQQRAGRRLEYLERYGEALAYYQQIVAADPSVSRRFETDLHSAEYRVDSARKIVAAGGRARGGFDEARYQLGMYAEVISSTSVDITSRLRADRTTIPDLESKGLDGSGASRQLNDSGLCYDFRLRALSHHALGRTDLALADMRGALERCQTTSWEGDLPKASFFMAAMLYNLGLLKDALSHVDVALRHERGDIVYTKLRNDITTALASPQR